MTHSWTEIYPDLDGPPVVGEPADFRGVQRAFARMHDDAADLVEQFAKITSDAGVSALKGDAATAFRRFVDNVSDSLGDLPGVCSAASTAFKTHADGLEALRKEVDTALAKASTNWDSHTTLTTELATAKSKVTSLQKQIDQLPPDDPSSTSSNTDLNNKKTTASGNVEDVQGKLDAVDKILKGIHDSWSGYKGREKDLRDATKHSLDDIDLHDLKDPGWFSSFCEGAFEFVMKYSGLDMIKDLVEAVISGDWAAVLWKLREILDVVMLVVTIVSLFTPIGPLVVLGMALAKLAIDGALMYTKWPNPETGETIGWKDIIVDGVGVALAGVPAAGALKGEAPTSMLQTGRNVIRAQSSNIARRGSALRNLGFDVQHARMAGRGWNLTKITSVTGLGKVLFNKGVDVAAVGKDTYYSPETVGNGLENEPSPTIFKTIAEKYGEPTAQTTVVVPNKQHRCLAAA